MPILTDYQPEATSGAHASPFMPTQYQVRPPTTRYELRTDNRFPALQVPILYVVRSSLLSTVVHNPLIDPPRPDRRLRLRHLCCVEHTGGL